MAKLARWAGMSLTSSTAAPPAHRSTRTRLLGSVASATLVGVAGVAVFSVFYLVGAAVGVAVMAAAGIALLASLAWLALKPKRRSTTA